MKFDLSAAVQKFDRWELTLVIEGVEYQTRAPSAADAARRQQLAVEAAGLAEAAKQGLAEGVAESLNDRLFESMEAMFAGDPPNLRQLADRNPDEFQSIVPAVDQYAAERSAKNARSVAAQVAATVKLAATPGAAPSTPGISLARS